MDKAKLRKYRTFPTLNLTDRTWPSKVINKAPTWCSVDLRDGNQALIQPMSLEEKLEFFKLLVELGFKQIEVGFPSAARVEFNFTRLLIDRGLIPDDVRIQVLTQVREHLIEKTFAAIEGAKSAVLHFYNSTSTLQREVVFRMSRKEILNLAVKGARMVRQFSERSDVDILYEYSPESFTGTELDFALEVCEAVMEELAATPERPVIVNLPATVELSTPNIYADQIEWFIRNLKQRDCAIISLHGHNDRGTGVAATELALMAGAQRVEGTLFGNGERTGNVDLVTLALNMYTQGVDPELDFTDINRVIAVCERCNKLSVHPRHPYAGELVYTAFSGSHQDAINKGMNTSKHDGKGVWAVPYLPIDPEDVGRTYESIIRINSQSGKGGIAYVMDKDFGFKLPKEMQPGFGRVIQRLSDESGDELPSAMIYEAFEREYLQMGDRLRLKTFNVLKRHFDDDDAGSTAEIQATVLVHGEERSMSATGNGPLDAFCAALQKELDVEFSLHAYHEHALTRGSSAKAVTYIEALDADNEGWWGAGIDTDIIVSSIKALLSSLNRMMRSRNL
ncbi:MAG: 2-isopropylmalate synthase [Deltaproteobacteria bacterium]|nr:MAG: 2-isopropylmalate synthase [Deltaproteobacteria bacterium]